MLVLTRKLGEDVVFVLTQQCLRELLEESSPDRPIVIRETMLEIRSGQAKSGYAADPRVGVHRDEIWRKIVAAEHLDPIERQSA